MPMNAMIECVPNISEGRRSEVIEAIVAAVRAVPGIRYLDTSSDADHNRSVLSFIGNESSLRQAILALYRESARWIDLRHHKGEHPRMGAVDVVPFIPIQNVTMAECVQLSRDVAADVQAAFGVPVILYEEAASAPHRRNLADIRKGEFEGMAQKMQTAHWQPDFGQAVPHPALGVSAIGAREALIAYNVYLNTNNLAVAQAIAKAVRGSSGGLAHVKGLGFLIEERNQVQVSMNLVNFRKNPIYRVQELIRIEAARYGVSVAGAELVGLIPQDALLESAAYYLQLEGYSRDMILENRIQSVEGTEGEGV
jgi:glutamate formiminotransferase